MLRSETKKSGIYNNLTLKMYNANDVIMNQKQNGKCANIPRVNDVCEETSSH